MSEDSDQRGFPKPPKFIWPPRRDRAIAAGGADRAEKATSGGANGVAAAAVPDEQSHIEAALEAPLDPAATMDLHPDRAMSPTVDHGGGDGGGRAVVAGRLDRGLLGRLLQDLEVEWLGQVTPPLHRRIAEVGWSADQPGDYCGRCGRTVGPHDADLTGCSKCRGVRQPWERMVRLGEFDGLLREVLHEVKYTRWRRLGEDVGRLLGRALAAEMERQGLEVARTVLVPVPTSFWRRIQRGIDHPLVIARGVSRETGLGICEGLYRRHRPTQQSLPASKRAANVTGAMLPRRWAGLHGVNVVLVDDVTTTRATIGAAARAVRKGMKAARDRAGESGGSNRVDGRVLGAVWAAVVAVTPEPGQR